MSASKARAPKLGRGLKSLMSTPVRVQPELVETEPDMQPDGDPGDGSGAVESAAEINSAAAPGAIRADVVDPADKVESRPASEEIDTNANRVETASSASSPATSSSNTVSSTNPDDTGDATIASRGSDGPPKADTPITSASATAAASAAPAAITPAPPATKQPPPSDSTTSTPPVSLAKPVRAPGRGYTPPASLPKPPAGIGTQAGISYLPVASLRANRHQPRQQFDEPALKRLADSIKSEGIMQPIVARPDGPDTGRYEVVAGERRWRAAKLAGLSTVPVIIRDLNDRQLAEWALIENLQREDLNPIERAEAFSRLIDQFGLSHEETGARIGMDRSSITNHLRLLGLCGPVKELIREGLLSMGQARALVTLSDEAQQQMLAERAVRQGMSVREVEAAVRKLSESSSASSKPAGAAARAPYLADLEKQIAEQLGTKVALKPGRKKGTGTLSIEFYSLDQFDALVNQLGVKTD